VISTGLDGVFTALHVCGGGVADMSIAGVGTSGAGVSMVEPQSMSPTIKHGDTIVHHDMLAGVVGDGDNWTSNGRMGTVTSTDGWWGRRCRNWGIADCQVCDVVSKLGSGEFAHAFLVFGGEVLAKLHESLAAGQVDVPHVTCSGEHAHGFEHEEGEVLDCIVGEGVTPGNR